MSCNRFRSNVARLLAVPAAALLGPAALLADGLPITPPVRTDAVRFQDEILPILAANCTACHNPKIHEGELHPAYCHVYVTTDARAPIESGEGSYGEGAVIVKAELEGAEAEGATP